MQHFWSRSPGRLGALKDGAGRDSAQHRKKRAGSAGTRSPWSSYGANQPFTVTSTRRAAELSVSEIVVSAGFQAPPRSEEHTSELQSLMRISYAVFCLKKKKQTAQQHTTNNISKQQITK